MNNKVVSVNPRGFKRVGGFIGKRFFANQSRSLKDHYLSGGFIHLHKAKNDDGWFLLGKQIGKWLDASTYSVLISDEKDLFQRVNETIERLEKAQVKDGYFGITSRHHRNPVRGMELYNATGKEIYQQVVLRSIDRILNEWLFLTGGMSSGDRFSEPSPPLF